MPRCASVSCGLGGEQSPLCGLGSSINKPSHRLSEQVAVQHELIRGELTPSTWRGGGGASPGRLVWGVPALRSPAPPASASAGLASSTV